MHSPVFLFLNNLFSSDMLIIMFVALLLFGGEKLPEIARGIGKGIRDFKDASEGIKREINDQINNYDRKEDRKTEEAIIANQANQNRLPANPDHLLEGHQPVQHTMPVNENHLSESETTAADNSQEASHGQAIETHSGVPYVDSMTTNNETVKNS